jgi:hypothetical protein
MFMTLVSLSLSRIHVTCQAHLTLLYLVTLIILSEEYEL